MNKTRKLMRIDKPPKKRFKQTPLLVAALASVMGINCSNTEPLYRVDDKPSDTPTWEPFVECIPERKYLDCGQSTIVSVPDPGLEHRDCFESSDAARRYYEENQDRFTSVQVGPLRVSVKSVGFENDSHGPIAFVAMDFTNECGTGINWAYSCNGSNITLDGEFSYFLYPVPLLPTWYNGISVSLFAIKAGDDGRSVEFAVETGECEVSERLTKYCFLTGGLLKRNVAGPGSTGPEYAPNRYDFENYTLTSDDSNNILILDRQTGELLATLGLEGGMFEHNFKIMVDGSTATLTGSFVYVMYRCLL